MEPSEFNSSYSYEYGFVSLPMFISSPNRQLEEEPELPPWPLPPLPLWTPQPLPPQPLRPLPTRALGPLVLILQPSQQLEQQREGELEQQQQQQQQQQRDLELEQQIESWIDVPDLGDVTGDEEANEVGVVGTGEDEMELDRLNSGCLGYEKSKEKTSGGQSGMILKDDAKDLNVNFVDEEGFSDTPPSDQASAVTVDTNSVVGKEIPTLQFSRTAQQKNSNEAFGNDEVEEGEIWAKTTEEGGTEGQFYSRCFAKRKRKEKSPRRGRRNKKTTGVRIGTPLEDILQTEGRSLKDDAKHLKGVEPTKFKWRARLRQREIKVDDTPSSKKQLKSVKGGASQSTSRGGFAESNVDVNTAGGQTPSKKRSTSVIGKGEIKIKKPCSIEPTNETAFRSSLRGIITLIKELNLRTCHKEVLKKTPFWGDI